MWTRHELKTRAKAVLKVSYWKAFLASLLIAIVSGRGGSAPNFNWDMRHNDFERMPSFENIDPGMLTAIIIAGITAGTIFILFALAFRIFLGYPLEVGGRKYFVQSARQDVNLNYLGYAFNKEKYINIIKAMFWRGLLNFLWFLLLIIPGIVKYYAYSMVPYILAENPGIDYKRAVELSKKMTDGEKFRMFVLDLSFIGWYLLGLLALFVGMLFVMPYENATKAELYLVLRQKALDNGTAGYDEFGIAG
ncbi:MAG: DUF975 family protein [Clostridia bacterium]|nr:DUF975 family protein [Clostridia bacterium]